MPRRKQYRSPTKDPLILLLILFGMGSGVLLVANQITPIILRYLPTMISFLMIATFATFILSIIYIKIRLKKLRALKILDVDRLSGDEFESYIVELLKYKGFTDVKKNGGFHDKGADILATKDDEKYAIQVKRYAIHNIVQRAAISDAVAAVAVYGASKSLVITTGYFSPDAKAVAKANNCQIIDRNKLIEMMADFNVKAD